MDKIQKFESASFPRGEGAGGQSGRTQLNLFFWSFPFPHLLPHFFLIYFIYCFFGLLSFVFCCGGLERHIIDAGDALFRIEKRKGDKGQDLLVAVGGWGRAVRVYILCALGYTYEEIFGKQKAEGVPVRESFADQFFNTENTS